MNTTMRNKAFTLVEILIVVIILGILAAIIIVAGIAVMSIVKRLSTQALRLS